MRSRSLLVWAVLFALTLNRPAGAQSERDLNDLVLEWASGRFASPVMCEIEGQLVRGIRRVIMKPRYTRGRRPELAVHFIDLRPDEATRCVNAMGKSQPNIMGKLLLQVSTTRHPETASRDFKRALKRDKGFDLAVREGILKLQEVAQPAVPPRLVDYKGQSASLRLVFPATDAARELAPFSSPRKMILVIEGPDLDRIVLPLFLASEDPV